jgi:TRAP-type C4-dicarboxylate transport system permease small subunit
MNNWKIVSQIATAFGIAFIVFAALAGFITYEQITIQYESSVPAIPASLVQLSVLGAMLPFMLFAVLSLVVAGLSSRSTKETDGKDAKPHIQPLQAA